MSDIPSTGPDNSAVLQQHQTPSGYEKVLGKEYQIQSSTVKGYILNVKDKNITIINNPEKYSELQNTKQQTEALSEDFKHEFIEKLKKLPDFAGSKVQEAIEKQTIEIKKIPGREGYAIYESKVGNLVYIARLDGTRYTNVDYFRDTPGYEDSLQAGYIREGYSKIILENGLWKLYDKNGKEVPIYSDEYMVATLNAVNLMWDVADFIVNEAIKRRKEGKID